MTKPTYAITNGSAAVQAARIIADELAHWADHVKAATDRASYCLAQIDMLQDK